MVLVELLENTHRGIGVHQPVAILLEVPELARRGVVEGEDDGRGALRQIDAPVEVVVEAQQAIAALPEALEVAAEVVRGTGPPFLGQVDLVVLEDHDAPELIARELSGAVGQGREREDRDQGDGERREPLHWAAVFFARAGAGRRAAAV